MITKVDTFLGRSGQRWKLYVGSWATVAAAIGMLANVHAILTVSYEQVPTWRWWLYVAVFPVMLAIGLWMSVNICCPSCGETLFWQAIHDRPVDGGLGSLWTLQHCPSCGSDGTSEWRRTPDFRASVSPRDTILGLDDRGGESPERNVPRR